MRERTEAERLGEAIFYLEYAILSYQTYAQSLMFPQDGFNMTFCPGTSVCSRFDKCRQIDGIGESIARRVHQHLVGSPWTQQVADYSRIAPWNPVFYGTSSSEYIYCKPSGIARNIRACYLEPLVDEGGRHERERAVIRNPEGRGENDFYLFEGVLGQEAGTAGARKTMLGCVVHEPAFRRAVVVFRGSRSGTTSDIINGGLRGIQNPDWGSDLTCGSPTEVRRFTARANRHDSWAGGWCDAFKRMAWSTGSSAASSAVSGAGVGAAVSWWSGPGALAGAGTGATAGALRGALGGAISGLKSCRDMDKVKVHTGFLNGYNSSSRRIRDILEHIAARNEIDEIVTTGHSLGAGLAEVAWMDLTDAPPRGCEDAKVRCYAYSAPTVATPLALVAFPEHEKNVFHFWSQGDPVVMSNGLVRDWGVLGEQFELTPPGISPGFTAHEPAVVMSALRRAAEKEGTPYGGTALEWGRSAVEYGLGAGASALVKRVLPGGEVISGALSDVTAGSAVTTASRRLTAWATGGTAPSEAGIHEFLKVTAATMFDEPLNRRERAHDFLDHYPLGGLKHFAAATDAWVAERRDRLAPVRAVREEIQRAASARALGEYLNTRDGGVQMERLAGLAASRETDVAHLCTFLHRHLEEVQKAQQYY